MAVSFVYAALWSMADSPTSGNIWKRGHMTFSNTGKLCSSQDDLKCSNYWLFPLVGDAANRHVKFSEPTSVQLLSLTCGQNKNWNEIYPDKYKASCLKQLFSKPNTQIETKEEWILFLETLFQTRSTFQRWDVNTDYWLDCTSLPKNIQVSNLLMCAVLSCNPIVPIPSYMSSFLAVWKLILFVSCIIKMKVERWQW